MEHIEELLRSKESLAWRSAMLPCANANKQKSKAKKRQRKRERELSQPLYCSLSRMKDDEDDDRNAKIGAKRQKQSDTSSDNDSEKMWSHRVDSLHRAVADGVYGDELATLCQQSIVDNFGNSDDDELILAREIERRARNIDDDAAVDGFVSALVDCAVQVQHAMLPAFVRCTALPRALRLSKPASRVFFASLAKLSSVAPDVVVDELLVGIVEATHGDVDRQTLELMMRLVRECLTAAKSRLFFDALVGAMCRRTQPTVELSAALLTLVRALVDSRQPPISERSAAALVHTLDAHAQRYRSERSFDTVLLSIVTKHPAHAKRHSDVLTDILNQSTSMIARSTLSKLNRIK
jgi:hypothetical protein